VAQQSLRLFFAVWLPKSAAAKAFPVWAKREISGRWTQPEDLHCTLLFLGPQPSEQLSAWVALGKKVAAETAPAKIEFDTWGAFPEPNAARVLWWGPSGQVEWWLTLRQSLLKAASDLGVEPAARAFIPHCTLARFAQPCNLLSLPGEVPVAPRLTWQVKAFYLCRSELSSTGAHYSRLERFTLG
jgi:2'-5' RNA ligase